MEKHNFVTIADLTKEKILYMIEMAEQFEKHPNRELLKGKVVATLFFEPSTRTRLSFETAANRLGARVIGFADPKITSGTKGETLKDTILMVSNYADVIVMRHYIEGAAQYASEVAPIPIVNAGDGAHQHPSQCMLDLYSIYKTQGRRAVPRPRRRQSVPPYACPTDGFLPKRSPPLINRFVWPAVPVRTAPAWPRRA